MWKQWNIRTSVSQSGMLEARTRFGLCGGTTSRTLRWSGGGGGGTTLRGGWYGPGQLAEFWALTPLPLARSYSSLTTVVLVWEAGF